jgi:hypothetical protein
MMMMKNAVLTHPPLKSRRINPSARILNQRRSPKRPLSRMCLPSCGFLRKFPIELRKTKPERYAALVTSFILNNRSAKNSNSNGPKN